MRIGTVLGALLLVAGAARAGGDDPSQLVTQVGDAVDQGDAWSDAVPRIAKLLGAPAAATDDQILWAVDRKGFCVVAEMKRDGLFVKSENVSGMSTEADEYKQCKKLASKHAKLPKLPAMPKVDVDTAARAVMALWKAGNYQALFDGAHSRLREDLQSPERFAHTAELYAPVAGKFVKLGAPLTHGVHHFAWVAKAPAIYEKGTLQAELRFDLEDGKPKLTGFELKIPPDMLAKRVPKEAEKVAHHALELLFADRLDDFILLAHPAMAGKLGPKAEFEKQLAGLMQKMGKIKKFSWNDIHDCAEQIPHDTEQCVSYDIDTTNGPAKGKVRMVMMVSQWRMLEFNVDPPTK